MLNWNEETAAFLRDASEYGDYYKCLAEWILPHLKGTEHLCDAGCGLGYLTLELSNYVNRITAVDSSEIALQTLGEKAKDRKNIHVINGNINCFTPAEKYDGMVFCFFGKMEEIAKIARTQCKGDLFLFKRNYVNKRFAVGEYSAGDDSFENAVDWLEKRRVPFVSDTLSPEMGQPFRGREDARRFFSLYHPGNGADITDAFLDSRLIETGRQDFPLYLPQKREVGCLWLQAADLPEEGTE